MIVRQRDGVLSGVTFGIPGFEHDHDDMLDAGEPASM
jgi:hypothetical protein